jgi:hypothetical protein
MPHAFKASPKHPAVAYLVRLHADLGGKIWENKKEAERLAENMKHVEAVIKLFNPAFNVRGIAVRRRYKGNPWFKRGTLFRHAMEIMRQTKVPLTSRQIAELLLASKGIHDRTVERDLANSVQASLRNREGKIVEVIGTGMPQRWRLK